MIGGLRDYARKLVMFEYRIEDRLGKGKEKVANRGWNSNRTQIQE
jgi:hypothetical protein